MRKLASTHRLSARRTWLCLMLAATLGTGAMFSAEAALAKSEGNSYGAAANENDIYVVQREGECLAGGPCDNGTVQCPNGEYVAQVFPDGTASCALSSQTRRVTP
jgi:hypothetical protein